MNGGGRMQQIASVLYSVLEISALITLILVCCVFFKKAFLRLIGKEEKDNAE